MPSRYISKRIFKKVKQDSHDILRERGLNNADIIETIFFKPLDAAAKAGLTVRPIIWQRKTRLFKLAHEFYGDSRLWWAIAWFNQKPTDAHYKIGDTVYIPSPIETVLRRII
jgi:hypothetical protein